MSTTTTVKKTTRVVKVVKREASNFYDDSFFEDSWGDFDSAIKQILHKFESDSTPKIDFGDRSVCKDVYRKIRTENISKDLYQSQALQVTEKDDKFQCVMDVKDFTPNELQVKVVDNRVVVDGKFEKVSEDGLSKSSKSFHKEFTLPSSADIEQVSTALSKDGVLTIKAPKREGGEVVSPSGAVTSSTQHQTSSLQTSSSVDDSSSSVVSSTKKESKSFSSTSTFSSTKKVSMSSTSSVDMSSSSSLADTMSKDVQDRLVFTHDSVDVKLPAKE